MHYDEVRVFLFIIMVLLYKPDSYRLCRSILLLVVLRNNDNYGFVAFLKHGFCVYIFIALFVVFS